MRKVLKDAFERAYDLAWPSCVRWRHPFDYNVRYYRYPAPASEHIDQEDKYIDYRTAYRDSIYHIRYDDETFNHSSVNYSIYDPMTETPLQKLVRVGAISEADLSNPERVEQATKAYEERTGQPLGQKGTHLYPLSNLALQEDHPNEVWASVIQNGCSRESLAYLIRNQFEKTNTANQEDPIQFNYHDLYHPELDLMQHLDMAAHDPVMRQTLLDDRLLVDMINNQHAERGHTRFFSGDPKFWHALDNTYSPENIKLVQSAIGDKITNLDTTALSTEHGKVDVHKETKAEHPIRTKFVS